VDWKLRLGRTIPLTWLNLSRSHPTLTFYDVLRSCLSLLMNASNTQLITWTTKSNFGNRSSTRKIVLIIFFYILVNEELIFLFDKETKRYLYFELIYDLFQHEKIF
jgi:hypothetical protein